MPASRDDCHLCHIHDHDNPSSLLRTSTLRDHPSPPPRSRRHSRSGSMDRDYHHHHRDRDRDHHHHHRHHHDRERHHSRSGRVPSALARLSEHNSHSLPASRSNTLNLYPEQVSVLPDGGHRFIGGDRVSVRSLELTSPRHAVDNRSHHSLTQTTTLQKPLVTDTLGSGFMPLHSHGGSHLSLQQGTVVPSPQDRNQDYYLQVNRLPFKEETRKHRFNLQTVLLIGCYTLLFVMAIIIGVVLCHQNGWLGFGSSSQVEVVSDNSPDVRGVAGGPIRRPNLENERFRNAGDGPGNGRQKSKDGTGKLTPVHNVVQVRKQDPANSLQSNSEGRPRSISGANDANANTVSNVPGNRPIQPIHTIDNTVGGVRANVNDGNNGQRTTIAQNIQTSSNQVLPPNSNPAPAVTVSSVTKSPPLRIILNAGHAGGVGGNGINANSVITTNGHGQPNWNAGQPHQLGTQGKTFDTRPSPVQFNPFSGDTRGSQAPLMNEQDSRFLSNSHSLTQSSPFNIFATAPRASNSPRRPQSASHVSSIPSSQNNAGLGLPPGATATLHALQQSNQIPRQRQNQPPQIISSVLLEQRSGEMRHSGPFIADQSPHTQTFKTGHTPQSTGIEMDDKEMEKMKILKEILDAEGSGKLLQDLITLKNNKNTISALSEQLSETAAGLHPESSAQAKPNSRGAVTPAVLEHQDSTPVFPPALPQTPKSQRPRRPQRVRQQPKSKSGPSKAPAAESKEKKKNNIQVVRELLASLISSPEVQDILNTRNRQGKQANLKGDKPGALDDLKNSAKGEEMRNMLLQALEKELPIERKAVDVPASGTRGSVPEEKPPRSRGALKRGEKAGQPRRTITRAQQLAHFSTGLPARSFNNRVGTPEGSQQLGSHEHQSVRPPRARSTRGRRRHVATGRSRGTEPQEGAKPVEDETDDIAVTEENTEGSGDVVREWRTMDQEGTMSQGTVHSDGSFAFSNCRPAFMCKKNPAT